MPQSVVIFGVLIFLFVVFITTKGQLPAYLAVIGIAPASNLPSSKTGVGSTLASGLTGPLNLNLGSGSSFSAQLGAAN